MSSKKHDWASLQRYLNAHERVLKTYHPQMDRAHSYKQTYVTPNYLLLECTGIIFTTYKGNKVRVDITKDIEIDDSIPNRFRALTVGYSYNANEPNGINLIRYDSPDSTITSATPHHHQFHHKHIWTNGVESVLKMGDDEWPHVDEFFREILNNH